MRSPLRSNGSSLVPRPSRKRGVPIAGAFALGLGVLAVAPPSVADPAAAGTAVPAKSLRHVRFDVSVGVQETTETKLDTVNGTGSASSLQSGINSRNGVDRHDTTSDASGSIDLDVIGATKDGDLDVAVSEATNRQRYPVLTVLVGYDGTLSYLAPPPVPLTTEESIVLRLFSRGGVLGGQTRAAGDAWTITTANGAYSSSASFRATSLSPENALSLSLALDEKQTGPQGFDAHTDATLAYDAKLLVPLNAHVRMRSHAASPQTLVTTDDTIEVVRVQDSFAPAPSPAASPQPAPAPAASG